jgi:CHAP domain
MKSSFTRSGLFSFNLSRWPTSNIEDQVVKFPDRVIKQGESNKPVVRVLKTALNNALALRGRQAIQLDPNNPLFGPRMKEAVMLFQLRNVDTTGRPLKVDGQVGALTWAALFGPESVPTSAAPSSPLLLAVLKCAGLAADNRVREKPVDSNRGPEVDEFMRRTGARPGLAWCCAFVYWCFDEAATQENRANPMFRTAGCLAHWNGAKSTSATRIPRSKAVNHPALVKAGMVFIMDYGGGAGHTGLVESVHGGIIFTIEGNTDASRTREGGGVYRLERKIVDINKGFIDYSPC